MATQVIAAGGIGIGFDGHATDVAEHNLALLAAQQRVRRGPTPEVLFIKHLDNTRLVRTEDPVRVREMRIFSAALTVLFLFLMVYGWQHFSAIESGYHVEAEKQQLETLQEQNRRLQLSEAQLRDPGRIDRVARALGLSSPQPGQMVRPDPVDDPNAPALAENAPATPAFH
ncbi:MAG TPA: cell division protein FtsL [Acidobacteriaceae bacterium]|jgi:cell division protein FtsL|nr:cell division protein FtsL [Acidobacteriaceae bacterium]